MLHPDPESHRQSKSVIEKQGYIKVSVLQGITAIFFLYKEARVLGNYSRFQVSFQVIPFTLRLRVWAPKTCASSPTASVDRSMTAICHASG